MTVLVGGCIVLFVRETFVCAACFVLFLFCLQMIICCVAVFFVRIFNANTYFYFSIVFDVDFVFPKYFLIHFPGKPFSGHCPGLAGIGTRDICFLYK